MTKPIPSKTLDALEQLLKRLIHGEPDIKVYQLDDVLKVQQELTGHLSSAYISEDTDKIEYVEYLGFSPAQIDVIESFAEDWRNGLVYQKHYDAEESQQDKLFTEFYKHYKG